jgi:hypothetical protein
MTSASETIAVKPRHRMSSRQRLLFFLTAWLIILMPFLFWWNTWFGRGLSDKQMEEYLHDDKKPRHIQHALIQLGEKMSRRDQAAVKWYPQVVRLASYPVEEVRNTDAWVMGQDTSGSGFHDALTRMLADISPIVRGNAALSLVRYGDASGRPQIVALLAPVTVKATRAGKVVNTSATGTAIHQGGVVAKLDSGEARSSISGRVRELFVKPGQDVSPGDPIAEISPASEQVWEALRALYLIGKLEDLPAVTPYERKLTDIPDHVREQAVLTEKAIRERAK